MMGDSRQMQSTQDVYLPLSGENAQQPIEWHTSLTGEKFNLHADKWQLTTKNSINVGLLRTLVPSPVLKEGIIRTLAFFARTKSYNHCDSISRQMRCLLQFWKKPFVDEIPAAAVASFRHFCRERDGNDVVISARIRPFLTKWYELGYAGISRELVEQMAEWTLTGMERGARANRLDPNEGPLMPDEALSFKVQALTAFERGSISLADYASFRLTSLGFRRPEQIVSLKCKDMDDSRVEERGPDNPPEKILLLNVPRIKAGRPWRKHFRSIPLSIDLWNLLVLHRTEVTRRFDRYMTAFGLDLQPQELALIHNELALFPAWKILKKTLQTLVTLLDLGHHGEAITRLRELVVSKTWHAETRTGVRDPLDRIISVVNPINRAGGALQSFATRFRYTAEFDLERQGCPPPVRAWNLDHNTTESLINYHTNGPDAAARLSKATAMGMSKYASMFQGMVVDRETDAEAGNDPDASRIFIHDAQEGATCAVRRGCGMTAIPLCCYAGCPQFRPWIDGPHEALLDELLEERDLLLKTLRPLEDRQMIEVNDSVILGVVQVIQLCEARRQEIAAKAVKADARKRRKGTPR